jgi:hypothetical protein
MSYLLQKIIQRIRMVISKDLQNFKFLLGQNSVLTSRSMSEKFINLWDAEVKVFSQWGEDGILDFICEKIGLTKPRVLEIGEIWWWESNRQIPINIFLSKEIFEFRYAIKHFSTKDVKVILGPCTSLNDIIVKRIKRKSITLIRKTP